jgi:hypothetical protein
MGRDQQPELPQRITGAALDDLTTAEAHDAVDLRDAKIAARVRAEGDRGGVL